MVERQGWGEIKEGLGAAVLKVLAERYGQCTIVRLASGEELTVYDGTGWGRDYGDMWEHVIARVTPLSEPARDFDSHLLYLSEVECLIDPESRKILIRQTPAPGET
jgi:hypothetical protein